MSFAVFTRTWWRRGDKPPHRLEPGLGRKRYLERGLTEDEARRRAQAWNRERYGDLHGDPEAKARYDAGLGQHHGLKAEFEES